MLFWTKRRAVRVQRADIARTLAPGTRVRVITTSFYGTLVGMNNRTGTLVRRKRLLNLRPGWLVELDRPAGDWKRMTFADSAIEQI